MNFLKAFHCLLYSRLKANIRRELFSLYYYYFAGLMFSFLKRKKEEEWYCWFNSWQTLIEKNNHFQVSSKTMVSRGPFLAWDGKYGTCNGSCEGGRAETIPQTGSKQLSSGSCMPGLCSEHSAHTTSCHWISRKTFPRPHESNGEHVMALKWGSSLQLVSSK